MAINKYMGFELAPEGMSVDGGDSYTAGSWSQTTTDEQLGSWRSSAFSPAVASGRYCSKIVVDRLQPRTSPSTFGMYVTSTNSQTPGTAGSVNGQMPWYRFYLYIPSQTLPTTGVTPLHSFMGGTSSTTPSHYVSIDWATRKMQIRQGTATILATSGAVLPLDTLMRVEGYWNSNNSISNVGVSAFAIYNAHSTTLITDASNSSTSFGGGTSAVLARAFRFGVDIRLASWNHNSPFTIYMDEIACGDAQCGPTTNPVVSPSTVSTNPIVSAPTTSSSFVMNDWLSPLTNRIRWYAAKDPNPVKMVLYRDGVEVAQAIPSLDDGYCYFTDYFDKGNKYGNYTAKTVRIANGIESPMSANAASITYATPPSPGVKPVIRQVAKVSATNVDAVNVVFSQPILQDSYVFFIIANTVNSGFTQFLVDSASPLASGVAQLNPALTQSFITSIQYIDVPSTRTAWIGATTVPLSTNGAGVQPAVTVYAMEVTGMLSKVYQYQNFWNSGDSGSTALSVRNTYIGNQYDQYAFYLESALPTTGNINSMWLPPELPARFDAAFNATESAPAITVHNLGYRAMKPQHPSPNGGTGLWGDRNASQVPMGVTGAFTSSRILMLNFGYGMETEQEKGTFRYDGTAEKRLGPPLGIYDGTVINPYGNETIV